MPQTQYSVDRVSAVAGQPVSKGHVVGRYQASEAIAFGLMTELHTDGKLRVYRGGKRAGVAMYRDAKEPGAWAIDDYVPVMREGVIWAQCTDAGAELTKANFSYKDTTAGDQGKATASIPTAASDGEVYDGGACHFVGAIVSATDSFGTVVSLCQLECDFMAERSNAPRTFSLVSQTANDFAISAENDALYEINTTGANSTVTLDPNTPDGVSCDVLADGTKNGHTLTFRDGSTSISAATTASKRVMARAAKAGGKWAVTLTVGP